tara:strand:+ start:1180 stop:1452 length:273 start_codon:yes stop_codon:yes gene_type:complete
VRPLVLLSCDPSPGPTTTPYTTIATKIAVKTLSDFLINFIVYFIPFKDGYVSIEHKYSAILDKLVKSQLLYLIILLLVFILVFREATAQS